uniref:Uncharacterized protein n=1 Tax=Junco hyemalis TaxID=40217 RepID=A0A8C5JHF8_JUNHY
WIVLISTSTYDIYPLLRKNSSTPKKCFYFLYPTNWFWGKQQCGVCCSSFPCAGSRLWLRPMDTGRFGLVWFVLLQGVSWACRAGRDVARAHPTPASAAILPWRPRPGILPCQPAVPLLGMGQGVSEGWRAVSCLVPAPGSSEHSSGRPLPPDACLTSGEPLTLSVLRHNKDTTKYISDIVPSAT